MDDKIEIIPIPILSPDAEQLRLAMAGWAPFRTMTKAEVLEKYPGAKIPEKKR